MFSSSPAYNQAQAESQQPRQPEIRNIAPKEAPRTLAERTQDRAVRKAKLQQLEVQSEIERRNANDELNNIQTREIRKRDNSTKEYEAKKSQVLAEANKMRHPENEPYFMKGPQTVNPKQNMRKFDKTQIREAPNFADQPVYKIQTNQEINRGTNILDINFRESPQDEVPQKKKPIKAIAQSGSDSKEIMKKKIRPDQIQGNANRKFQIDLFCLELSQSSSTVNYNAQFMTGAPANIKSQMPGNISRSRPNDEYSNSQTNNQFLPKGDLASLARGLVSDQNMEFVTMTPNPKGKGSGSKSRRRRPKRPQNKFMQPMQGTNVNMGFNNMNNEPVKPSHELMNQQQFNMTNSQSSDFNMNPSKPYQNMAPQISNQLPRAEEMNQMYRSQDVDQMMRNENQNRISRQEFPDQMMQAQAALQNKPPPQTNQLRMASQPPPQVRTPAKPPADEIDDDPFRGIGFSNSGVNKQQNGFDDYNFNNNSNFFMGSNGNRSQISGSQNNFDDPFADLMFDNKNKEPEMLAIEAPPPKQSYQTPSQSDKKERRQSVQYNFDEEPQQTDSFAFDEININLDDLILNDSPMPKPNQPPETKRKISVNSGMPMDSHRSNQDMFNQEMRQPSNPNLQNFDMNKRQMGNQNINFMPNNSPPQNQNMRPHNMNPMPSPEMFNTVVRTDRPVPIENKKDDFDFFSDNTQSVPKRADNSNPYMFNNPNNFKTIAPGSNPTNFRDDRNSRAMSQNIREPAPMPSQDYGFTQKPMQNMNSGFNNLMGTQNNYAKNQPNPNDFMTSMNMQSTTNQTNLAKTNQMDPFANAEIGYNPGSFAAGFNTMAVGKQKRKNPFAKGAGMGGGMFQSSSNFTTNNAFSDNRPPELSDLFSSSSMSIEPKSNMHSASPFMDMFGGMTQEYGGQQNYFNKPQNMSNKLNFEQQPSFGINQAPPSQPSNMFGGASSNSMSSSNVADSDPFAELFT